MPGSRLHLSPLGRVGALDNHRLARGAPTLHGVRIPGDRALSDSNTLGKLASRLATVKAGLAETRQGQDLGHPEKWHRFDLQGGSRSAMRSTSYRPPTGKKRP